MGANRPLALKKQSGGPLGFDPCEQMAETDQKNSQGVGWGEGCAAALVSGGVGDRGRCGVRARCTAPAQRRSHNAKVYPCYANGAKNGQASSSL